MRIGIIVDGREEQNTFGIITSKIAIENIQILTPVYAPLAPKATPLQIAKALESRIKILCTKDVDKIVVTIDLEDLQECPGERALAIQKAIEKLGYIHVEVVIKNRKFENWLIGDIENLSGIKHFSVSKAFAMQLKNCDAIPDAVKELSKIKANRLHYSKTKDGAALAKNINPIKIAQNSRSFKKFMKVICHPDFIEKVEE